MIRSFRNKVSKRVYEGERPSKLAGLNFDLAMTRLDMLDAAVSLQSLSPLKSVGLHPLKGDRKGQWAMLVTGRWRICFRFEDGHAFDVEVVDYHKG